MGDVDLNSRIRGLRRQADTVGYQVQQECVKLRRTARLARTHYGIGTAVAMELERDANEREAAMTWINRTLGQPS